MKWFVAWGVFVIAVCRLFQWIKKRDAVRGTPRERSG
jgi:hypothetical protein